MITSRHPNLYRTTTHDEAEAEGLKGIAAFVLVAALLFIARLAGLF